MSVEMSVITFVNNRKEETGKTLSLVAIATNMAIEYNEKILIISTTDRESKMKSCFFEDNEVKKIRLGIFGQKVSALDTEAGIEGLIKMLRSNKLTPEMITNYTKVVFKDRLEVLLGKSKKEGNTNENGFYEAPIEITNEYIEIVKIANQYYDKVFVDLDNNLSEIKSIANAYIGIQKQSDGFNGTELFDYTLDELNQLVNK